MLWDEIWAIYIYGWGYIGNVIIPTDFHSIIFQRGRSTTNQLLNTGIFHCHACPPAGWCCRYLGTLPLKQQHSNEEGLAIPSKRHSCVVAPSPQKQHLYAQFCQNLGYFLTRLCCIQYTQLLYGHITIGFEISITAGEPCLFLVVSLVISELCQLVFYCENLIYPLPLDDCAPYRAHGTHGDPC